MIESFAHKGLKRFYEDNDGRKLAVDMLGAHRHQSRRP